MSPIALQLGGCGPNQKRSGTKVRLINEENNPMDGITYLALAAKAKLVFESPDTFMSFPALSPISYTADQLNFGVFNSPDPAERLVYSEFSRLVNALPSKTIFEMGDKFLWDVYGTVLRSAILANSQTTAQETAAYQQAALFLNTTDASGLATASPQFLAYRQFRDAWFAAVQNYKAEQSTAAASTDKAAVAQWENVDEPRLRAAVEQANAAWEAKGFKKQVEDAQQVVQNFGSRSPELIWHTWSALYDPSIDVQTDAAQQPFVPTSFVPADVCSQDWLTFKLTAAEIIQLAAQAPDELKRLFAAQGTQPTVDTLSFEYRSVALARHWFKPDLFYARFWRLPKGMEQLSDGGHPPQGSWPAYVAAVVLIRNIQLTMRADHPAPPQLIRTLPALRYVTAEGTGVAGPRRLAPVAITAVPHQPPPITRPPLSGPPAGVRAPVQLTPNHFAVMVPARPMVAPRIVPPAAAIGAFRPRPIFVPRPFPPAAPPHPSPDPVVAKPPPPQGATPPSPPPASVPDPKKDISIFAFICRPFGETPNPDPNLDWGGQASP
jgi:hypothetical protein